MTFPSGISLCEVAPNTLTVIGRLVIVFVSIKMVNLTSGGKSITNYIPANMRPSGNVGMSAGTGNADGKLQPVTLRPDGTLSIYPVVTGTTTYAQGSVVYALG